MTIRSLVASFLVVLLASLVGACGSPSTTDGGASEDRAAVWQIDDDANLAYPTCWNCSADVDRSIASCDQCGARVHIEAKTIACPECDGSKTCIHCAPGALCVACADCKLCPICDGTGTWHGDTCPECEGAKTCPACPAGAAAEPCERCGDTNVCANCDGKGEIVLK